MDRLLLVGKLAFRHTSQTTTFWALLLLAVAMLPTIAEDSDAPMRIEYSIRSELPANIRRESTVADDYYRRGSGISLQSRSSLVNLNGQFGNSKPGDVWLCNFENSVEFSLDLPPMASDIELTCDFVTPTKERRKGSVSVFCGQNECIGKVELTNPNLSPGRLTVVVLDATKLKKGMTNTVKFIASEDAVWWLKELRCSFLLQAKWSLPNGQQAVLDLLSPLPGAEQGWGPNGARLPQGSDLPIRWRSRSIPNASSISLYYTLRGEPAKRVLMPGGFMLPMSYQHFANIEADNHLAGFPASDVGCYFPNFKPRLDDLMSATSHKVDLQLEVHSEGILGPLDDPQRKFPFACLRELPVRGFRSDVRAGVVQFSKDSRRLLVGGKVRYSKATKTDVCLQVFDIATGNELESFAVPASDAEPTSRSKDFEVTSIALRGPDAAGETLVFGAGSDGALYQWSSQSLNSPNANKASVSPITKKYQVLDVNKKGVEFEGVPLRSVALSPDGRFVLAGTGKIKAADNKKEAAVHVWSTSTQMQTYQVRNTDSGTAKDIADPSVFGLAVFRSGEKVVVAQLTASESLSGQSVVSCWQLSADGSVAFPEKAKHLTVPYGTRLSYSQVETEPELLVSGNSPSVHLTRVSKLSGEQAEVVPVELEKDRFAQSCNAMYLHQNRFFALVRTFQTQEGKLCSSLDELKSKKGTLMPSNPVSSGDLHCWEVCDLVVAPNKKWFAIVWRMPEPLANATGTPTTAPIVPSMRGLGRFVEIWGIPD